MGTSNSVSVDQVAGTFKESFKAIDDAFKKAGQGAILRHTAEHGLYAKAGTGNKWLGDAQARQAKFNCAASYVQNLLGDQIGKYVLQKLNNEKHPEEYNQISREDWAKVPELIAEFHHNDVEKTQAYRTKIEIQSSVRAFADHAETLQSLRDNFSSDALKSMRAPEAVRLEAAKDALGVTEEVLGVLDFAIEESRSLQKKLTELEQNPSSLSVSEKEKLFNELKDSAQLFFQLDETLSQLPLRTYFNFAKGAALRHALECERLINTQFTADERSLFTGDGPELKGVGAALILDKLQAIKNAPDDSPVLTGLLHAPEPTPAPKELYAKSEKHSPYSLAGMIKDYNSELARLKRLITELKKENSAELLPMLEKTIERAQFLNRSILNHQHHFGKSVISGGRDNTQEWNDHRFLLNMAETLIGALKREPSILEVSGHHRIKDDDEDEDMYAPRASSVDSNESEMRPRAYADDRNDRLGALENVNVTNKKVEGEESDDDILQHRAEYKDDNAAPIDPNRPAEASEEAAV